MNLLQDLFKQVLDLSITASYVAIAVMVARIFLSKSPKIFSFILWGVVLFRLVSPISFISKFSIFNLFNRGPGDFQNISYVDAATEVLEVISVPMNFNSKNSISEFTMAVVDLSLLENIFNISTIIWIIGIQVLLVIGIVSYIKLLAKIKTATLIENNIYESDRIDTAFVCGFIRPKIYIPTSLNKKERQYIIEHEKIHIKRFDYITKVISSLLLTIHWFNPIMWVSFILMSKDMEMSCDEKVMKKLGDNIKVDYSNSLLSLATDKKVSFLPPIAFGENSTKSRIKNVLNYKKPKFWAILLVFTLVVGMSIFLISNPDNDWKNNSTKLVTQVDTLVEKSENKELTVDDFKEITPFKWDYMYSFTPYTPKEDIENTIGFKWSKISESVNEGTNQVIFTKGDKVVCYFNGYPEYDKVYFDFRSSTNGNIKLSSKENIKFYIYDVDEYKILSFMGGDNYISKTYTSNGRKVEVGISDEGFSTPIVHIEDTRNLEEIGKILFEESLKINEEYYEKIKSYKITYVSLMEELGEDKYQVKIAYDLEANEGYENDLDTGNGVNMNNGWTVGKYQILEIEKLHENRYKLTNWYTG
ncbi:M56 family metallopeptidase [Terrisporobacter sp.]|uniref:M56 family metallopeptidase n=1 Tax=Terrisporobacter sp. TaxID=1965305 RepID=UPI0026374384|nr:M56 family metallopeptidase [Terrisporobacter sp.]